MGFENLLQRGDQSFARQLDAALVDHVDAGVDEADAGALAHDPLDGLDTARVRDVVGVVEQNERRAALLRPANAYVATRPCAPVSRLKQHRQLARVLLAEGQQAVTRVGVRRGVVHDHEHPIRVGLGEQGTDRLLEASPPTEAGPRSGASRTWLEPRSLCSWRGECLTCVSSRSSAAAGLRGAIVTRRS